MNELVTGPGISEALKRRFGITEPRPVEAVATELFPTMDVSDNGIQPDLALLAHAPRYAGFYLITPGATSQGMIALRNPEDSGIIATVEKVIIGGLSPTWWLWIGRGTSAEAGAAAPGGSKHGTPLDTRMLGPSTPCDLASLIVEYWITGSPAPAGCSIARFAGYMDSDKNQAPEWNEPVVLGPGGFLVAWAGTANDEMFTSFAWQERVLQSWEQWQL